MEPAQPKAPVHADGGRSRRTASVAITACLLTVSVAGGALLVWWALAFHPSNQQLWMVPFGLVVFGTPIFVWFALFASNNFPSFKLMLKSSAPASAPAPAPAPASDIDVER
ncbi:hypothetical protein J5N97_019140 [Dioscorea zingiberensis]|uniref:Transmembrane protein n=1 Tax=Dioscorea zingiberensis TaxID=325984 RepID=A0A9D5CDE5_9LILI|nr:hypothetical protein J5N97_019140 [Dioscorea zingiberensis]